MCPGLVSLTCFHSKHFQISFKWVSCRFEGWSRLLRGDPSFLTFCKYWQYLTINDHWRFDGKYDRSGVEVYVFFGCQPTASISWLALCRANLQSLKLLSQHAAKASHISSQGPSVDCSFTLGNVHLSQRASTRPWLQPGSCRRPAEEDLDWRWPGRQWLGRRSQGLGLWVASCSMHHNAEGAALISKSYIYIIYILLILFNFSKHFPSLPLCLVACSTGECWSSLRQTPFWSTGSSSGMFSVLRRKVTTCSFLEWNLMDFVPFFQFSFPHKGFC